VDHWRHEKLCRSAPAFLVDFRCGLRFRCCRSTRTVDLQQPIADQHLQKPRLSSGRQPFGNENAAFVWIEPQDVHLNFVAEHLAK
jgi:hypothetical protein